MKKLTIFSLFIYLLYTSCNKEVVCNVEIEKIIVSIVDDITRRHPMGYFIAPPHQNCFNYIGTIDVSQTLYALSTSLKYEAFSKQDVEQMKLKMKSKGIIIQDCYNADQELDLNVIASALNMKFINTQHHPMKGQFRYEIGGPEGLFYFTPPIKIRHDHDNIYSVAVAYHCGKLCFDHRLYFLYKYEEEYVILNFEMFDQE